MSLPAWFGARAWWLGQVVAGESFANPQRATAREQQRAYDYFVRVFPQFVLCKFCRRHYRRLVAVSPPDVADRDRLFAWFSAIHDAVNKRLRRPAFGVERARAAYARLSSADKCAIVRDALQLLAFEYSLYEADKSAQKETGGDGDGDGRSDTEQHADDAAAGRNGGGGGGGENDDDDEEKDKDDEEDDGGGGGGESDADWSNVDEALRGAWFYTRAPYAARTVRRSDYRTDAGWWFDAHVDGEQPFVASAVAADRLPYATLDEAWRAYGIEKSRVYRRVRDSQLAKKRTSAAAAAAARAEEAAARTRRKVSSTAVPKTRGRTSRGRVGRRRRRRMLQPARAGGDGADDFAVAAAAATKDAENSDTSWRSATVAGVALVGVILIAYCISAARRSARGRNRRSSSRVSRHHTLTARPTSRTNATDGGSGAEPRFAE